MNKELLGKRISELRKSKKLKQEFLAEKLGIEPRQLSKLETGKHYPSYETITALLDVFQISFEELTETAHLKPKTELLEEIDKILKDFNEEQLKIVYKFIRSLSL